MALIMVLTFFWNLFFSVLPRISGSFSSLLVQRLYKPTDAELNLRSQRSDLKMEQEKISMADHFAAYMKLQRRIDKLSQEIKQLGNQRLQKITMTNVGLKISFKVIYAMGILTVVYLYRGTPLFFLPVEWLWPLHKFVAFPSGVAGGVGVGFWMLCCNTVVGRLLSFLPAPAKDGGQSAFNFPMSIPIPEPSDIPLD